MRADEFYIDDDDYDDRYFAATSHYDALGMICEELSDIRLELESVARESIEARELTVRVEELVKQRTELETEIKRLAAVAYAARRSRLDGCLNCD